MTIAELTALCLSKMLEDPFPFTEDLPGEDPSPERPEAATDRLRIYTDYSETLVSAFREIFSTLCKELGMTRREVDLLPPDTPLPPKTNALAERFKRFPVEMTEGEVMDPENGDEDPS